MQCAFIMCASVCAACACVCVRVRDFLRYISRGGGAGRGEGGEGGRGLCSMQVIL